MVTSTEKINEDGKRHLQKFKMLTPLLMCSCKYAYATRLCLCLCERANVVNSCLLLLLVLVLVQFTLIRDVTWRGITFCLHFHWYYYFHTFPLTKIWFPKQLNCIAQARSRFCKYIHYVCVCVCESVRACVQTTFELTEWVVFIIILWTALLLAQYLSY